MRRYEEEYHVKQMEKPYRSTEVFKKWLVDRHILNYTDKLCICDMACGGGVQTLFT